MFGAPPSSEPLNTNGASSGLPTNRMICPAVALVGVRAMTSTRSPEPMLASPRLYLVFHPVSQKQVSFVLMPPSRRTLSSSPPWPPTRYILIWFPAASRRRSRKLRVMASFSNRNRIRLLLGTTNTGVCAVALEMGDWPFTSTIAPGLEGIWHTFVALDPVPAQSSAHWLMVLNTPREVLVRPTLPALSYSMSLMANVYVYAAAGSTLGMS